MPRRRATSSAGAAHHLRRDGRADGRLRPRDLGSRRPTETGWMTHRGRHLAVVPAYNEEASVARVIDSLSEHVPDFDVLVVDDGSTDATGEIARGGRARSVLRHPFNLGHRRRRAVRLHRTRCEHGYDYMVQVDGDGQHDPAEIATPARARWTRTTRRHGLRLALPRRGAGYPAPISRRTGIHIFAFLLSRDLRPARDRPDLGLPPLQPPRDRAVRARLPARLPGGRGGADGPRPPAADARGARCGCIQRGGGAPRSRSGKSVYYMIKVLLAIFVGLARAARCRARRRGAGRGERGI